MAPSSHAQAGGARRAAPAAIGAEALGRELARMLTDQAPSHERDSSALAKALSLDAERVCVELAYLLILTSEFCVGVALGDTRVKTRVVEAFEQALWTSAPWRVTSTGLRARLREYRDALSHPHPELGRAYVVGRTFARHCGCSPDVAAIDFGARAYIEQLPRVLARLRGGVS